MYLGDLKYAHIALTTSAATLSNNKNRFNNNKNIFRNNYNSFNNNIQYNFLFQIINEKRKEYKMKKASNYYGMSN